jgi:hypothetical protein
MTDKAEAEEEAWKGRIFFILEYIKVVAIHT